MGDEDGVAGSKVSNVAAGVVGLYLPLPRQ